MSKLVLPVIELSWNDFLCSPYQLIELNERNHKLIMEVSRWRTSLLFAFVTSHIGKDKKTEHIDIGKLGKTHHEIQ